MINILGFVSENITDMKDTKRYLGKIWEKEKKKAMRTKKREKNIIIKEKVGRRKKLTKENRK